MSMIATGEGGVNCVCDLGRKRGGGGGGERKGMTFETLTQQCLGNGNDTKVPW